MFFILERKNENKLAICKVILFLIKEKDLSLSHLSDYLELSEVTVRNLVKEINRELGDGIYIRIKNNKIILSKNIYTIDQIVNFYCTNDYGYKILKILFLSPNIYTVEQLSQSLYISRPQVYKIIKYFNERLSPYNMSIKLDNGVYLSGPEKLVNNLFFEIVSLLDESNAELNISPDKSLLKRQVNIIFAEYNIIPSPFNTNAFSNWVLTCLNWNYIANKKSIILTKEKNANKFPFYLDDEFISIGSTILKNLGKADPTNIEIKMLYLGLANLTLRFISVQDDLFFQNRFMEYNLIKQSNHNIDTCVNDISAIIVAKDGFSCSRFNPKILIYFILNYIKYFFVTWRNNLDLYQLTHENTLDNYNKILEICQKNLNLENTFIEETYARIFCLLIDYSNFQVKLDVLTNKKFVFESSLGFSKENIILSRIHSLYSTSYDQPDANYDYLYIVDDARLIKDPNKKYILLKDFYAYMNKLF